MLVFKDRGKLEYQGKKKTHRSRVENQQQTQPIHDAGEGERSHHCAIPTSQEICLCFLQLFDRPYVSRARSICRKKVKMLLIGLGSVLIVKNCNCGIWSNGSIIVFILQGLPWFELVYFIYVLSVNFDLKKGPGFAKVRRVWGKNGRKRWKSLSSPSLSPL